MVKFGVFWHRYDNKFLIEVGKLIYNYNEKTWYFLYDKEGVEDALKLGFQLFPEFPDLQKEYKSSKLFITFLNRIDDNLTRKYPLITEEEKINKINENKAIIETDNIFLEGENQNVKKRR